MLRRGLLAFPALAAQGILAVWLLGSSHADASEYCVVCDGPPAQYRCLTDDGRDGPGSDQSAWLPCISELAKSGGHQSCQFDRATTPPCAGEARHITLRPLPTPAQPPVAPVAAPTPLPAESAPVPQPPPDAQAAQPAEGGADGSGPGNVESSKEGLAKAGGAIGDAAQKSWDCMASLFKKC